MVPVEAPRSLSRSLAIAAPYVAAVLLFSILMGAFYRRHTGFTTLIEFGEQFEDIRMPAVRDAPHVVQFGSSGYDGQFYAQLAVDPLLRDPALYTALDNPAYRARRVFFSWTAWVLGLGRPEWVLKAYAAQNIVAWLLLAWLLLRWLPPSGGRHFAAWAACLFGVGLIGSVRYALVEGPGLLVLAMAVVAVERQRLRVASLLMAAVGLGRDTNLLSAGVLIDWVPRTAAEAIRIAGRVAVAVVPLLLWLLYIRLVYFRFGLAGEDNFAPPFAAFVDRWQDALGGLWRHGWWGEGGYRVKLAATMGLTVQAGYLVARREWESPWWRAGAAYAVLLPLLGPSVWDGIPGAATRVLLPMSVAFNILVVGSRWFWPLFILGNLAIPYSLVLLRVPWLSTRL